MQHYFSKENISLSLFSTFTKKLFLEHASVSLKKRPYKNRKAKSSQFNKRFPLGSLYYSYTFILRRHYLWRSTKIKGKRKLTDENN